MSQERWDVVLRFLNGPLQYEGDLVLRGPVVRIGANPGPGGLKLDGYRALDDRQAVVTAYDGGTASIAPVGTNQVRMAPHEHVDWSEVQPLRGPTFLSNGCALHFGPPGRGATAVFVECRRLGVWEQRAILSDASQAEPDIRPTEVRELDATKRFPWWLIPGFLGVLMMFVGSLGVLVFAYLQRRVEELGPVDEGLESYGCRGADGCDQVLTEKVEPSLYTGVKQAFHDFVVRPDAQAAQWDALEQDESKWDRKLMEWVTRAEKIHGEGWTFWMQLDDAKDSYATVLGELHKAGLPDVFAAIPFQESRYKGSAWDTMLCAAGFWQFQPEVAFRVGVEVRDCKFRGSNVPWSPTQKAPPRNVLKKAEYVENGHCRIDRGGCDVDQRAELLPSTRGAVELLKEAFTDEELRFSGAVVQMTIASHNAGYDNSRFQDGVNKYNILPAYRDWVKEKKANRGPDFVGDNITCTQPGQAKDFLDQCGGHLGNVTQKYVPFVIAQHMLAVCYFGANYASEYPVFADYQQYLRPGNYCADIHVPTKEDIAKRRTKGK